MNFRLLVTCLGSIRKWNNRSSKLHTVAIEFMKLHLHFGIRGNQILNDPQSDFMSVRTIFILEQTEEYTRRIFIVLLTLE